MVLRTSGFRRAHSAWGPGWDEGCGTGRSVGRAGVWGSSSPPRAGAGCGLGERSQLVSPVRQLSPQAPLLGSSSRLPLPLRAWGDGQQPGAVLPPAVSPHLPTGMQGTLLLCPDFSPSVLLLPAGTLADTGALLARCGDGSSMCDTAQLPTGCSSLGLCSPDAGSAPSPTVFLLNRPGPLRAPSFAKCVQRSVSRGRPRDSRREGFCFLIPDQCTPCGVGSPSAQRSPASPDTPTYPPSHPGSFRTVPPWRRLPVKDSPPNPRRVSFQ